MTIKLLNFLLSLLSFNLTMSQSWSWCDCSIPRGTEQEYNRSNLVIQGKIIGIDTIYGSNTLISDHKGAKLGRHKYSLEIEKLARLQMVVGKSFKSTVNVGDTIYVLTPAGCAPVNLPPYLGIMPEQYYNFIVYGDKWIENKVTMVKKRKRYIKQIEQKLISNTFLTDRCRRTDITTDAELANLSKCLE
jgi:hypothetical protein